MKRYYINKQIPDYLKQISEYKWEDKYRIIDRISDTIVCISAYSEYANIICDLLNNQKREIKNVKSNSSVKQ